MHCPRTPFSTRLSGNAKETELRIRNIFQWQKQRPPLMLLAVILILAVSCGGLVSCQQDSQVELPELVLEDGSRVYVELQEPDAAEEALGDIVGAVYYESPNGRGMRLDQLGFGPDHPYWETLSLKPFQKVLGHSGVVVGYSSGSTWYNCDYYAIKEESSTDEMAALIAAAYNVVHEVDLDGDGQRELISNYHTMGYLDVFQQGDNDDEIIGLSCNEGARRLLGLPEESWVVLRYQEDGGVSAQWTEKTGGEKKQQIDLTELLYAARESLVAPKVKVNIVEKVDLTYAGSTISPEQQALLDTLPSEELPRKPLEVHSMHVDGIWRETLIPVAADEAHDVTLYGVVTEESIQPNEYGYLLSSTLDPGGIVLRCEDRTAYYPLSWDGNLLRGGNPNLYVEDYDGDGEAEAAVVLHCGTGTGVSAYQLYLFELDTLDCSVPDCSTLDIQVDYDAETYLATLSGGECTLTLEVPEYCRDFRDVHCGNIVNFFCENGQLYCCTGLDFAMTTAYLAEAIAPVIYQDGRYCLGPAVSLTATDG